MTDNPADPPHHKNGSIATRFKKGHAKLGGRKKGTKNTATLLRIHLQDKVWVTQNGRRRRISKHELGTIKIADKVAQADLKAFEFYEQATARDVTQNTGTITDPLDELTLEHVIEHLRDSLQDAVATPLASVGAAPVEPYPSVSEEE